jgi:ribonuclease HI
MSISEGQIVAYTDGACIPNPGRGGWAVLLIQNHKETILCGNDPETTNNRMELTAAIQALESQSKPSHFQFHTDSQYLQKGIQEWLPVWQAHQWKMKGRTIANRDLWERLLKATKKHSIEWLWVRGHAGDRYNSRVDILAKRAIYQRDHCQSSINKD